MLLATLMLAGCSMTTNYNNGLYCIDGEMYMMADGSLLKGMDENDKPIECQLVKR
jgi:hypothetical protein